ARCGTGGVGCRTVVVSGTGADGCAPSGNSSPATVREGGTSMPRLEVCVATPYSIEAAHDGGADRLELCTGLETGGLTPSAGLVDTALAHNVPDGVRVLVRPRPGGFVYTPDEVAVMVSDIRRF